MNIVKSGSVPKLKTPIVLVHGLFGFDRIKMAGLTVASYFPGVYECIESAGNRVLVPKLHPIGGVAHRAQELKEYLLQHSPNEPVHIIAHSMGGLDSRYMISKLGMADKVLSLTTLGTPHRGSSFADWTMGKLKSSAVFQSNIQGLAPLGKWAPALANGIAALADWTMDKVEKSVRPALKSLNIPDQAFDDLTTANCRIFNEEVLNVPSVSYYSVAAHLQPADLSPEFLASYPIVSKVEGPNDGVVSVASAQWGEGFEVWEGDHFSLVNWIHLYAKNRTVFSDPAPRFGPLLRRLADKGF